MPYQFSQLKERTLKSFHKTVYRALKYNPQLTFYDFILLTNSISTLNDISPVFSINIID